jgi:Rrf2 family protein
MFSKTFGHAIRATTYTAIHGINGDRVSLSDLSVKLEIPHHFLGKIMQDLVRNGILDSIKGPHGGFFTNDSTLETKLIDILKITDGVLLFEQCALGMKRCNANRPCLLHHDFALCRDGMLKILAVKTIQELTKQTEDSQIFLI